MTIENDETRLFIFLAHIISSLVPSAGVYRVVDERHVFTCWLSHSTNIVINEIIDIENPSNMSKISKFRVQ